MADASEVASQRSFGTQRSNVTGRTLTFPEIMDGMLPELTEPSVRCSLGDAVRGSTRGSTWSPASFDDDSTRSEERLCLSRAGIATREEQRRGLVELGSCDVSWALDSGSWADGEWATCEAQLEKESAEKTAERLSYFGDVRQAVRLREVTGGSEKSLEFVDETLSPSRPASPALQRPSPRVQFARAIVESYAQHGTLPLPVLLHRKKAAPRTLDLTGAGVGDSVIGALARMVASLPSLDTLLLRDNRLTDDSLGPLLRAIAAAPPTFALTDLDLSCNDFDAAANVALRGMLENKTCGIARLTLCRADVDDGECCELMLAVQRNMSLRYLNLAENSIGAQEQLNAVVPDHVTGGEAVADMLSCNLSLLHLDLSWNFVRQESAKSLALSLAVNKTLTRLDLSMNSLADEPAQHLGQALETNRALTELNLSFNRISQRAAIVMAVALERNHGLQKLDLSGNPLGQSGGRALAKAMRCCQREDRFLLIALADADLGPQSPDLYDFVHGKVGPLHLPNVSRSRANPALTSYTLDMALPFERTIAVVLYQLASTHPGCRFEQLSHAPALGGPFQKIELKRGKSESAQEEKQQRKSALVEHCSERLISALEDARAAASDGLQAVREFLEALGARPSDQLVAQTLARLTPVAEPVTEPQQLLHLVFGALFDSVDTDASAVIGVTEMWAALEQLGVADASLAHAKRVIAKFDLDSSGLMERAEFAQWASGHFTEPPGEHHAALLTDARSGSAWVVPTKGVVRCEVFRDGAAAAEPPGASALGNLGLVRNIRAARSREDKLRIFEAAVIESDLCFTREHAQHLLEECQVDLSLEQMLEKLLPAVCSRRDAAQLVEKNQTLPERVKLRESLGPALFDVLCGNPNGHYSLDLADPAQRHVAAKLAEINERERALSKLAQRADTSMHGNWNNYRNEFLDHSAVELKQNWVVPTCGRFACDFVSTRRPRTTDRATSARRFEQIVRSLRSVPTLDDDDDDDDTRSEFFEPTKGTRDSRRRLLRALVARDSTTGVAAKVSPPSSRPTTPSTVTSPLVMSDARRVKKVSSRELPFWATRRSGERFGELRASSSKWTHWTNSFFGGEPRIEEPVAVVEDEDNSDEDEEERCVKVDVPRVARPESDETDDVLEQFSLMDASDLAHERRAPDCAVSSDFATAYHWLSWLSVATSNLWLSCDQVKSLVELAPARDLMRVRAAVTLHARCVDLEHFHRVLAALEPEEQAELLHRLGVLNVLNPVVPDRGYCLELRTRDHREYLKVLIQLQQEQREPGQTWLHASYRASFLSLEVPDWTLPAAWATEDVENKGGPPRVGRVRFIHTSDKCEPNSDLRRKLQLKTLCGGKLDRW